MRAACLCLAVTLVCAGIAGGVLYAIGVIPHGISKDTSSPTPSNLASPSFSPSASLTPVSISSSPTASLSLFTSPSHTPSGSTTHTTSPSASLTVTASTSRSSSSSPTLSITPSSSPSATTSTSVASSTSPTASPTVTKSASTTPTTSASDSISSSPSPSKNPSKAQSSNSSTGTVVGAVLGSSVGAAVLAFGIVWTRRRRAIVVAPFVPEDITAVAEPMTKTPTAAESDPIIEYQRLGREARRIFATALSMAEQGKPEDAKRLYRLAFDTVVEAEGLKLSPAQIAQIDPSKDVARLRSFLEAELES
eukprot:c13187_g1_i1.p1 GENE.c13187_g1_i1~~c13187_g1_i1.p1  ORF type:complete len:322 (-),score=57.72 c13187_g1_i1:100-1020(-)